MKRTLRKHGSHPDLSSRCGLMSETPCDASGISRLIRRRRRRTKSILELGYVKIYNFTRNVLVVI